MDVKILVGKRVKELRNKLGISQEELADLAELDRTYITSVECGRRNISIVNIEKLATALKVTLKEFFDFQECHMNYTLEEFIERFILSSLTFVGVVCDML